MGTSGATKGAYSFIAKGADGSSSTPMTIDSSGNVGIGTTSPTKRLCITALDSGTAALCIDAGTGFLDRGVITTHVARQTQLALVRASVATWGFDITSGGTAIMTSQDIGLNILSMSLINGDVIAGNSVVNPASGFSDQKGFGYAYSTGQVQIATTANGAAMEIGKNNANDGNIIVFRKQGTTVGNISITGSATTYNSGSDYRLKDITGPVINSGAFIDALKPKVGSWKSDGSKFIGFLAHEFAEVSPSSVSGEKDAVDADGKPVYQSMQASSAEVIANLVAELQSLRQRLAALESK